MLRLAFLIYVLLLDYRALPVNAEPVFALCDIDFLQKNARAHQDAGSDEKS